MQHRIPHPNVSPTLLAASLRNLIAERSISIIVRLVNNIRPTLDLVLTTIHANGSIIATGGTLLTRRNTRIFRTTSTTNISICCRTTITKTVPVIEPLHASLINSTVATIGNVIGNAAGCVLSRVRARN